ncbi:MAG: DUF2721 domain-containing protein [Candidatus Puniceispirillales bacterium]|jgi:hypothetical protein|tara:strand:- start:1166 stop:1576 length:411 start_codon:yes stop_codon:yes gene_type:complete
MDNLILLPAILFPAIPLMMVNFGNRYNSLSTLIRKIHDELINKKISKKDKSAMRYLAQIKILQQRLILNRLIQTIAAISFLVNLISIVFGFKYQAYFINTFLLAVLLFSISIILYIYELQISAQALDKHLEDLEEL